MNLLQSFWPMKLRKKDSAKNEKNVLGNATSYEPYIGYLKINNSLHKPVHESFYIRFGGFHNHSLPYFPLARTEKAFAICCTLYNIIPVIFYFPSIVISTPLFLTYLWLISWLPMVSRPDLLVASVKMNGRTEMKANKHLLRETLNISKAITYHCWSPTIPFI